MTPEIARKVISQFRGASEASTEVESLSSRERQVLDLVMQGAANKHIADKMGVSVAGVKFHLQNIYAKLHVHSRTEAAVKFKTGKSLGH